jgi:hypothetical protein
MSTAIATSLFDHLVTSVNTSPYVSASMMLVLNLGGRFLGLELTKKQEAFFTHPYVRRFLIFCILFVATRNIIIAGWMTILIILLIGYITNEKSALCIFGKGPIDSTKCSAEGFTDGGQEINTLTPEEDNILKMLLDKKSRKSATATSATATATSTNKTTNIIEKYKTNIAKLA